MARILITVGLLLTACGVLLWLVPGLFAWFGRLPGDIRYEGEHTQVYAPIVSMLLLSAVFSLLMQLYVRFFR